MVIGLELELELGLDLRLGFKGLWTQ